MKELFLSYTRADKEDVDRIYMSLKQRGLDPWMDDPPAPYQREGIPTGVEWDSFLRARMRSARAVLLFLSRNSIAKEGYVQREFRLALAYLEERPVGEQYVIPVLLESCDVPDIRVETVSLKSLQWYHLYKHGLPVLLDQLANLTKPQDASEPLETPDLVRLAFQNELRWWQSQLEQKELRIVELQRSLSEAHVNLSLERTEHLSEMRDKDRGH